MQLAEMAADFATSPESVSGLFSSLLSFDREVMLVMLVHIPISLTVVRVGQIKSIVFL